MTVQFSETTFPFATGALTEADASDDINSRRAKEDNFEATVILEKDTGEAFSPLAVGAMACPLGSNRAEMGTVGHVNTELRNVKADLDEDCNSTTTLDSDPKDVSVPVQAPSRLQGMRGGSHFESNNLSSTKDNEQHSHHSIPICVPFGTDGSTSGFNNNTQLWQKRDHPQNEMDTCREPNPTVVENKFGDDEPDNYTSMQLTEPASCNIVKKLPEANKVNDQMTAIKAIKDNDCVSGLLIEQPTSDSLWVAMKPNAKDLLLHNKQDDMNTTNKHHHGNGKSDASSMCILQPLAPTHLTMSDIQYRFDADKIPRGNLDPDYSDPEKDWLMDKVNKQNKLGDNGISSLILGYHSEDVAPKSGQAYPDTADDTERRPEEDIQDNIIDDEGNDYYGSTVIVSLLNQDITNCRSVYPVKDTVDSDPMQTLILHQSSKEKGDWGSSKQEVEGFSSRHDGESCSSGLEEDSLSSNGTTENYASTDDYKWTPVLLDKNLLGCGEYS